MTASASRPPSPAATLILARDGPDGMEVFLMQRAREASFAGGAYVFPGGAVDDSDSDSFWASGSLDDPEASRILGLADGGLAAFAAAIRECFEEAGILLAEDERGELVALDDCGVAEEFARLRRALNEGERTFPEICRARGLRPATGRLAYLSHWITPVGVPRRFDTRFFVALAPVRQSASHDGGEMIDHLWIRPFDALERHKRGEMTLMFVTMRHLEMLAAFPDVAAVAAHAMAQRSVPVVQPRIASARGGRRMLVPGEPAYAEIGKLDPTGEGRSSCEIVPGVVTRLSERVRRLTAPNPGFMTGPGTNTYLLSAGEGVAVIDPGPADETHVRAILEHAGEPIRWILATHTHLDHSPAAALLAERTGAQVIGRPAPGHARQDRSFAPGLSPAHGDRLSLGGCALRVLHTPGHASNHLCFLLEGERMLFTGDHVMQGSTVVINPPDGDMAAYLASLGALLEEPVDWLAPGHGFLIAEPRRAIERLLAHRGDREAKVLRVLAAMGAARLEDLVPAVYDDAPPFKYPVASRSLLAHLLKLAAEGRARERDGQWSLERAAGA